MKPHRIRLLRVSGAMLLDGAMPPFISHPQALTWDGKVFLQGPTTMERGDAITMYREVDSYGLGPDFWSQSGPR